MSLRKFFGTDGVRGLVNQDPMTAEFAMSLGRATAHLLKTELNLGRPPKVLVGKDTRLSGYMLEPALTSGLVSQGADVYLVGPLPTPGIAFMTSSTRADAGLVISASHNPYTDNGIKIFFGDGYKLPDEAEARLESYMDPAVINASRPAAEGLGRAKRIDDAVGRYVVFLKNTFPRHLDLEGLHIVLDCAHGAAYKSAPLVFTELGAKVDVIGDKPDGTNINFQCGSLHPKVCADKVVELGADLGLALDGDADRVIIIDHEGRVVDGDQIMNICARAMKKEGTLKGGAVVATVMSNMGLEIALKEAGINLIRTKVGDRYVVEQMRSGGYNFGGEQSGHLIFLDHGTTGDGTLAALQILAVMKKEGRTLKELAAEMTCLPQVLLNVKVSRPAEALTTPVLSEAVDKIGRLLSGRGRILLRPSGTEPVVRVMVEGDNLDEISKLAAETAELAGKVLN